MWKSFVNDETSIYFYWTKKTAKSSPSTSKHIYHAQSSTSSTWGSHCLRNLGDAALLPSCHSPYLYTCSGVSLLGCSGGGGGEHSLGDGPQTHCSHESETTPWVIPRARKPVLYLVSPDTGLHPSLLNRSLLLRARNPKMFEFKTHHYSLPTTDPQGSYWVSPSLQNRVMSTCSVSPVWLS